MQALVGLLVLMRPEKPWEAMANAYDKVTEQVSRDLGLKFPKTVNSALLKVIIIVYAGSEGQCERTRAANRRACPRVWHEGTRA